MHSLIIAITALTLFSCTSTLAKLLKGLLLTGGYCHNYDNQKKIIQGFTTDEINITWDVVHEGGKETKSPSPKNPFMLRRLI